MQNNRIACRRDPKKKIGRMLHVFSMLFLCVSALVASVGPLLDPRFPDAGTIFAITRLDPAWMYAISEAVARGLVFGRDILFTYGPYASLWTTQYHPATDVMTLVSGMFFGFCYMILCAWLARGTRFYWLLMFGVMITFWIILRDVLFTSYPLLNALLVYRLTLPAEHKRSLELRQNWLLALLFMPFGLLPLIKGSFLVVAGGISILICAQLCKTQRWLLASLSLIVPIFSCLFFWILAGQPASGLPGFFSGIAPIMSGYGAAMGVKVDYPTIVEIGLFVLPLLFLPSLLLHDSSVPLFSRLFLLLSYGIFLFLSFKSAFTRTERIHDLNGAAALFIVALTFSLAVHHRLFNFLPLFLTLPWVVIQTTMLLGYEDTAKPGSSDMITVTGGNLRNSFDMAWTGLSARFSAQDAMYRRFDDSLKSIRAFYTIPVFKGTVDIYSYGQTYLLASQNRWSPRPVLQSYSAYTPRLLERDADHLRGKEAPDTIFFTVEPIDDRFPSMEDGASWPLLMHNYNITSMSSDYPDHTYLVLEKKKITSEPIPERILQERHLMGETVELSSKEEPLYAQIDVTQSLMGKIVGALFKPAELRMIVTLKSGERKSYRIVSGMIQTPFLISPLVKNTGDFAMLMQGSGNGMTKNKVVSLEVRSAEEGGRGYAWNASYTLTLSRFTSGTGNQ